MATTDERIRAASLAYAEAQRQKAEKQRLKEEAECLRRNHRIAQNKHGKEKSRVRSGLGHWCMVEHRFASEHLLLNALVDCSVYEAPWSFESRRGSEALANHLGMPLRSMERAIARLKRDGFLVVSHTDPDNPRWIRYTIAPSVIEAMQQLGRKRSK